MKISNFYSRPFLKAAFFIMLIFALSNALILLTNIHPFSLPIHIVLSALFIVACLYLLTKEVFIKYDSRDDMIEIVHSRLFSSSKKPGSSFFGYVKYRVRSFEIIDRWYGTKLIINYETMNGEISRNEIPFSFLSSRRIDFIKKDLSKIINIDFDSDTMFIGSNLRNPFA
jgi:hypothetical protein